MDTTERKKAIKGVFLAALVGVPVIAAQSGMVTLPPAAARPEAREEVTQTPSSEEDGSAPTQIKQLASGEHCLSGWDGSFPALKDAVKSRLRNPRSFEHVETVRSPVDKKGSFGLIMTYRAENGFGGLNVEAIAVEVNAATCRFKRASNASLARRLQASS